MSRDNLDENGWRRSECEAAAGSGVMISLDLPAHFVPLNLLSYLQP
jgi:hypothetical protein